jgi:hypothetical protein
MADLLPNDRQSASQRQSIISALHAPTLHLQIPKQHRVAIYYLIKFIYITIYINYLYINILLQHEAQRWKTPNGALERWSVGARKLVAFVLAV